MVRLRDKRGETEEDETEERETISWQMENEGKATTEGERSGRSAAELTMTPTMITEDENKEDLIERTGNQEMKIKENWHRSETSSTQIRMTDFEAQIVAIIERTK